MGVRVAVLVALIAVVAAVFPNPALDAQCQDWVAGNLKDLIMSTQVASGSHIKTCQQFCMVSGSRFRADASTCRHLCDASGSYPKFLKSFTLKGASANPVDVCAAMLKKSGNDEDDTVVSMIQVAQTTPVVQRSMGVRGDMTVQGTLSAALLTSPIGDVKVSGDLNVMNQVQAASARSAYLKSDGGVSVTGSIVSMNDQLIIKGRISADSVTANTLHSSFLELDGVRQWSLFSLEDFEETDIVGWSQSGFSECAGRKILGGHCVGDAAGNLLTKTYTSLPPHTQVRINAQYLFIDSWDGESGYLKVGDNIVWSEAYNHAHGEKGHGLNVCGNETPERRFNRPVDVVIPHTADSLTITFGATTDEHPCDESYGIDSVMVFTR